MILLCWPNTSSQTRRLGSHLGSTARITCITEWRVFFFFFFGRPLQAKVSCCGRRVFFFFRIRSDTLVLFSLFLRTFFRAVYRNAQIFIRTHTIIHHWIGPGNWPGRDGTSFGAFFFFFLPNFDIFMRRYRKPEKFEISRVAPDDSKFAHVVRKVKSRNRLR